MRKVYFLSLFLLLSAISIFAQKRETGTVKGTIFEKTSDIPLEFANVVIKNQTDSSFMKGVVADKDGKFEFSGLPLGEYRITYSFIGFDESKTPVIKIDSKQTKIDLGKIYISETFQSVNEVEVVGQKSTFVNSIDRKTFNVGQDLMSTTGSVSDLMQNIPSVQVDIDGNVSLRGSENVMILVNGKPSAMMNLNRAAVLQQMSANSIERIEIITNPSAKYKPDGTSGIINIVMKKDKGLGLNGNLSGNVGNDNRYNFNVMTNYNPGKLNIYGSFGIRHDDRIRIGESVTNTFNDAGPVNYSKSTTIGHANPISNIANGGFDYKLNDKNKIGVSVNYNYRFQRQIDSSTYSLQNSHHTLVLAYDRDRVLPEAESDLEVSSFFQHSFDKEGHEINVTLMVSKTTEDENNYYTNTYQAPYPIVRYDNMFYHHLNQSSELAVEYTRPISEGRKLEAGYLFDYFKNDLNLLRDTLDLIDNIWQIDFGRSNRFIRTEYTHVAYLTYEQELGKFGFLAGIRGELTHTRADLVSKDSVILTQYPRFYPTLHLSYKLTGSQELQLNYSHRIRRPEDEELNPFPEYQDLQNVRIGNPYLKPEDIHSFEFGYQLKQNSTTFLSTLYYRYHFNGITNVTTDLGNGKFQNSLENLAKNQAYGLELIYSASLGKLGSFNLSTNTFYNSIDATSLGFSSKSVISWSASGNLGLNLTKSSVWQLTSSYTGESLTPQGKRLPTFVINTAIKQEVFKKKAAIILTVSDVFNSLKNRYVLDTPGIYRDETRRRSSRIIYLGFTYSFGNSAKKQKDNGIKYDNQL